MTMVHFVHSGHLWIILDQRSIPAEFQSSGRDDHLQVFSGGRLVAKLSPGSFVGEVLLMGCHGDEQNRGARMKLCQVGYLLHEGLHSPSATVQALKETHLQMQPHDFLATHNSLWPRPYDTCTVYSLVSNIFSLGL